MSANNHIYTLYHSFLVSNPFKGYIGFDSNWPKRKQDHFYGMIGESQVYFHKALRKYEFISFQWDILYQSLEYEHTKKIMEEYFIREYHTHISEGGYNLTYGGEGMHGWHPNEEQREKMRKGQLGRKHKPETIEKMKNNYKQHPEWYPSRKTIELGAAACRGKHLSDEHRQKISTSIKGIPKLQTKNYQIYAKKRLWIVNKEGKLFHTTNPNDPRFFTDEYQRGMKWKN